MATIDTVQDEVSEAMAKNGILDAYVGRVIPIVTKDGEWTASNGRVHKYKSHAFAPDRDLINEMIAIIEQHGFMPRITFPETIITCDFQLYRFNVSLKPISDTEAVVNIVGIG